jgi:hypothetical protein
MTRNVATTVENNFVLGLITERTELRFPQNAATDIDNCVIDLYGRVTRRKGLDFEEGYVAKTVDSDGGLWHTEYLWEGVGGDSSVSFFVQQIGSTLYFSSASSTIAVGANFITDTVDLTDFLTDQSPEDPAKFPCSYAVGNGKLFVANAGCQPFYLDYKSGGIEGTQVDINIRDFRGLDDGLDIDETFHGDADDLFDDNPEHFYNLLNQGWYDEEAFGAWDTAYTDLPSNCDIVSLYKAQSTQAFSEDIADVVFPGNTLAPRGHFILDAFNPDRVSAAADVIGDNLDLPGNTTPITHDATIGNFSFTGDAFDGSFIDDDGSSAQFFGTLGSIGLKHTATSKCASATVNFAYDIEYDHDMTFELRGQVADTTITNFATAGVQLATGTVARNTHRAPDPLYMFSTDTATAFTFLWINVRRADGSQEYSSISEVSFYASENDQITFKRPSCVAFFNGRSFYAGTASSKQAGLIYFSRIIETDPHYNQFYGDNDPTSPYFSDPLPSDGGYISIPDVGLVTKLFATQTSLLVLATNGIWLIGGSGGAPFDASSYSVSKLSGIGSQCPQTVVDYKGTPVWWGDDGIYSVQFDPNFNSYTVVSLTQDSIKTFFNGIPAIDRQTAKGLYNVEEDIVYWLYADDNAPDADANTYNKVLCYVPRAKAYYPWTFEDSDFLLRGFYYMKDAVRSQIPVIKFAVIKPGVSNDSLYYAEVSNDAYKDWVTYAIAQNDDTKEIDYTSYVAVGYYIHGETQRFFQGNYLFVFVDQDLQGSAYVNTHYDWTTTGNSGKWGTPQQIYPDWQTLQLVNYRRLKTRGKGRAMQLYFESESGKPFSIIGWSIWESGNAGI